MTTLSSEERLIGLATVWSEVKYNYPMWHRHPDLNWDTAFRERVPQALAEQSDWDYCRLLQAFAGSTGNPLAFNLPGGGGFRVCTRYILLPDGSEFISIGIPPDIEVCPTPEDVACGRDPVLERAVAELVNYGAEQQTQEAF